MLYKDAVSDSAPILIRFYYERLHKVQVARGEFDQHPVYSCINHFSLGICSTCQMAGVWLSERPVPVPILFKDEARRYLEKFEESYKLYSRLELHSSSVYIARPVADKKSFSTFVCWFNT